MSLLSLLNVNAVFVIWRELFEAVLIVTIVHAFLARRLPTHAVWRIAGTGIGLGLALSLLVGYGFQLAQGGLSGEALEHFQTGALLVCAVLMAQMCLWMKRHAKDIKKNLESSLGNALGADAGLSRASVAVVVGLVALAIAREGFEVVVFLYGMGLSAGENGVAAVAVSAGAGALLAGISAWCLARGIKFVNQRLFFRVTSVFLLLTASSMVLAAFSRLIQGGQVPTLVDQVWDTSWLLDDRSGVGSFVASLTGYQATPALISALAYAAFWLLYLGAGWLLDRRARPATVVVKTAVATALALFVIPTPEAAAQGPEGKLKLRLTGFGDMQAAWYDHGPNRTLKDGAPKDSRATFDATRFVARLEGFYLLHDVEFEAELEIEHGGNGTALELEYEESGEYEAEVEKGGEVQLEEFYLKKVVSTELIVTVGRIKVAVGLVPMYMVPTDYLGTRRSEAETHVVPESWTEMGIEALLELAAVRLRAQVVNGLDSTGFSSEYWVASGHQGRFELVSATDLAGVLRADVTAIGAEIGASAYYGGTSRNRPQPDLVRACDKSSDAQVAPCGYVEAPVVIADLHATVRLESLRGAASIVWGQLKNAAKVAERNGRLSNNLGVARTPVADEALAAWAEVGYDVAPLVGLGNETRLEPFLRYESYDTMYKAHGAQVDNPRFARKIAALGAAYTKDGALFLKLDASRRTFGTEHLRPETTVSSGLGFIY